jgi:colicin import membrane protein
MDSTLAREDFLPTRPEGMGKGLALAVLAHLLLIVALAFSVHWRSSEPAGVEAELWAAVPQQAAPRANEPEPVKPVARPEPRPEPPPPPVKRAAPPAPVEPPPAPKVADAQIAIEKAQKAEKARREEAERLEDAKREKAKRDEAKRKEDLRKDEQRKEELRKEELRKEQREQDRREAAEREKAAREKEAADRKKKEQADAQRQAKALEAQREANLKRIAGMAGASGDERATGSALHSAGPSAGYAGRIRARIKPNIVFNDSSVPGNPVASVEVRVSPDGTITSRKIVKSSGIPAWDDAVLRAIDRTEVLPKDTDGRIPPAFALEFRPRD